MNATETQQHTACPECGSETILYKAPHQYAGMGECQNTDCGASDSHECVDFNTEVVECDTTTNGEHDTYKTTVNICVTCGVEQDN